MRKLCKQSYYCESNSPEIVKLAMEITKSFKAKLKKVKSIFLWVRDSVKYDILPMTSAKCYLRDFGKAKKPIDYYLPGLIKGASEYFKIKLECVETNCIACGDPACVFAINIKV